MLTLACTCVAVRPEHNQSEDDCEEADGTVPLTTWEPQRMVFKWKTVTIETQLSEVMFTSTSNIIS